MNKKIALLSIIGAFVIGTLVSSTSVSAEKGGPFTEIWASIFGLQTEVDELEKRVEALENPQPPTPPIVSEVIIPQGTSTPGCETNKECFIPDEVAVLKGGTITCKNTDSAAHSVTAGSANEGPSGEFVSSLFMAGITFAHTFNSIGEFPYFCMVHPWMNGKVVVI